MATSKFITGDRSYIDKAAEYLDQRGLTIQELPIDPYKHVDLGFYTKRKGGSEMYEPLVLEGWAFKVRKENGDYYEDRWLLRVCNWPDEQIYQRRGGRICVVAGTPPKFIQVGPKGADLTSFVSTIEELAHSKVVMFHEKFTSAALARRLLGIPSIALSGCTNWSQDGKVKDSILRVIENMELSAKLVVCFDGDILNNPNVMHAASQLKGWVHSIRKDIQCIFPSVPTMPEGKNGWDDWVVMQGDDAADNWSDLIAEDGVVVLTGLPIQFLVQEYQVKTKFVKDKLVIEHTAANYARLLRHPLWANYTRDTLGGIYNKEDLSLGRISMDDLYREYEMWLADTVFQGDGASVRSTQVKEAVKAVMKNRTQPLAHHVLSSLPEVSEEEARNSALRLITEGMLVTGPMSQEQTVETMIYVFRDMVAMWDDDRRVDCQWALVLIGPSGCGKSNFPKSIIEPLERMGYETSPGQLAKDGSRASIDELMRQCRDCHVGVFDEYNPDDKNARTIEQDLFTLTSTRSFTQRKMYEEDGTKQLRHGSLFLTTVDKNEKFIRSTKGAGERRFIIFNVKGVVVGPDGKITSNRQVIAECSLILLRYGLQLYQADNMSPSATKYSVLYTDSYISVSPVEAKIAHFWGAKGMDLHQRLTAFHQEQFREQTGDVRWGPSQMTALLCPEKAPSRQDAVDITNIICECGAVDIGQARVHQAGKLIMKDKAYAVAEKDWDAFVDAVVGRFGA